MNERALQTVAQPTTVADCRISAQLWTLLSSNQPCEVELETIAQTPALLAEAKTVAPMLRQLATTGCGEEAVKLALQPLVLVYGVSDAARTAAFWRVYIKALSDVPAEGLAKAVEEYTRQPDAEFFPKPGPLRALALKCAGPIYQAASRSWRASKMVAQRRPVEATTEQRKAVAESVLASFKPRDIEPAGGVG